jgi:hypothetical protein
MTYEKALMACFLMLGLATVIRACNPPTYMTPQGRPIDPVEQTK